MPLIEEGDINRRNCGVFLRHFIFTYLVSSRGVVGDLLLFPLTSSQGDPHGTSHGNRRRIS